MDHWGIVPHCRNVLARTGFAGGNGDWPLRGRSRDPDHVFPGPDFLRVSFGGICVFAAYFHALAARRTPLAVGPGWGRSLRADDLGGALGVARYRYRGTGRPWPPDRRSALSRRARDCRTSPVPRI